MYLKGKIFRDNDYLDWVRRRPCLVSGSTQQVVAHHVRIGLSGGMGLKPSDYRTLPLDARLHRLLHDTGEKTFWKEHNIDPIKAIITQAIVYLTELIVSSDREDATRSVEDAIWFLREKMRKRDS